MNEMMIKKQNNIFSNKPPPKPHNDRIHHTRIIFELAFAALLTFSLSALIAYTANRPPTNSKTIWILRSDRNPFLIVAVKHEFGHDLLIDVTQLPSVETIPEREGSISECPTWSRDHLIDKNKGSDYSRACLATGWPFRAFKTEFTQVTYKQPYTIFNGIRIPTKKNTSFYKIPYAIPCNPIWLGLLANTIFFFLIMESINQFITWARCKHRIKHHHCPQCGYNLKGLTIQQSPRCPECGWNR